MISKKYSLTLTDEAFEVLNSLEREGYNLRYILNAGVILFDEAEQDVRNRSMLTAFGQLTQELNFCEMRLQRALGWFTARKGRGVFTPEQEKHAERLQKALDEQVSVATLEAALIDAEKQKQEKDGTA